MKLEVGKTYVTRGDWDALVIWKSNSGDTFQVIHKPKTEDESYPVPHRASGKVWGATFAVNAPPNYDREHPADVIKEKR